MSHQPSAQQLAALRVLPKGRSVLLQYHWRSVCNAVPGLPSTARIVTQAHVDLLAVGRSNRLWSSIWLLQYPNAACAEAHINSAEMQALLNADNEVEVLVASAPHPRMQKLIRLLNRFMHWLPAPRQGPTLPEEELQGGINPTVAQMATFRAADQSRPIHMFNLLKFHQRAAYADGDHQLSGRKAYETHYGKVAMSCFLRLGGRIVAVGRYRLTLLGAGGDPAVDSWDEIAVVQYPNRPAFEHMLSNPGYVAALEHRHAGLAETQLWSATPAPEFL